MKILDRLFLSVAALGVGIGCALAVTHVDDVARADADFAPSTVGYPYGTRFAGSVWRFNSSPDFLAFPVSGRILVNGQIYEQGYSANFDTFTEFQRNNTSLFFTGGHDDFDVIAGEGTKFVVSFSSDAFLNASNNLLSEENRLAIGEWLSQNATLLEPPTDEIPEHGLSMSGNTTLLFFRLIDLVSQYSTSTFTFYDLDRNSNLYVNFSNVQYLMPYSVEFDDTTNGFRITNMRFLATTGSNFFYTGLPFLFERDGAYVWQYGYKFDPAGSSSSYFSLHSTYFYSHWGYACAFKSSGTNMTFGFAPSALIDYFTNEFTGNSAYAYLERIRPYVNAFLGYSQFVYADNETAFNERSWQNGYENGYNAGRGDGEQTGYQAGYEEGRRVGYNQGQASVTDETTAVMNLFGAVISVPIGVLNGLSPLAIWNTPIIAIIVTFLFMGVVFMILKKVL